MVKRLKQLIFAGVFGLSLISTDVAKASVSLTTSAEVNTNNIVSGIDYKLSDAELEDVYQQALSNTNLKTVDRDESSIFMTTRVDRDLSSLSGYNENVKTAKAWLINNNVLSRRVTLDTSSLTATVEEDDDQDSASLSTFYMMLYKAENGVIPSNTFYWTDRLQRGGSSDSTSLIGVSTGGSTSGSGYWDEDVNASFVGDYFTYRSPNVKELYIQAMRDLGMLSDVEEDRLINAIKTPGKWKKTTANEWSGNVNCLGKGYSYSGHTLKEEDFDCFKYNDNITLMEALTKIAAFMRIYENISTTEANIVAYKYGITQFVNVDKEYLNDIYYLVCAGIISFDGSGPKYNLAQGSTYITNAQMYDLIYRVANKGARYNFSYVQLTDAETTFMDLGFSQNDLEVCEVDYAPLYKRTDIEGTGWVDDNDPDKLTKYRTFVEEVKDTEDTVALEWLNPFNVLTVNAASGDRVTHEYIVTKSFDYAVMKGKQEVATGNEYTFTSEITSKTYNINNDDKDTDSIKSHTSELSEEIVKIEDVNAAGNYKVYTVEFKVRATSIAAAVQKVEGQINYKKRSVKPTTKMLSGVTKLVEGDQEITLVSQSSLKSLGTIGVLHDKILVNTETGARCLIQSSLTKKSDMSDTTSYGYALIGTQIISGVGPLSVEFDGDDVYYNIQLIMGLLSNADLTNLGLGTPSKVNDSVMIYKITNELEAGWDYENSATEDDTIAVNKFRYIVLRNDGVPVPGHGAADAALYSVPTLSKGISSVSRTFYIKQSANAKVANKFTFILDFTYAPVDTDHTIDDVKTVGELNNVVFTRPESNKYAQAIWDRNYTMSNALCNMMYGTEGKVYIRSGFMVPRLTVLIPDNTNYFPTEKYGIKDIDLNQTSIHQFFNEELHFLKEDEKWTYYTGLTAKNNGLHVLYPGNDLETVLSAQLEDEEDSLITKMVKYYTEFKADYIRVCVADTKITDYSTQMGLTVYKNGDNKIRAALSDSGVLYREIGQPKTLWNEKELKSPIVPTYDNSTHKTLTKIKIRTEVDPDTTSETLTESVQGTKAYTQAGYPVSITKSTLDGPTPLCKLLTCAFPSDELQFTDSDTIGSWDQTGAFAFSADIYYYSDKVKAWNKKLTGTTILSTGWDKYVANAGVAPEQFIQNSLLPTMSEVEFAFTNMASFNSPGESGYHWFRESPDIEKASNSDCLGIDALVVKDGVVFIKYDKASKASGCTAAKASILCTESFDALRWAKTKYYLRDAIEDYVSKFTFADNDGIDNCRILLYPYVCLPNGYMVDTVSKQNVKNDIETFFDVQSCNTSSSYSSIRIENIVAKKFEYGKRGNKTVKIIKPKAKVNAYRQFFECASINEQVIDSMIAKEVGLTRLEELPNGSSLIIGSSVWYKVGDYWESHPMKVSKGSAQRISDVLKDTNKVRDEINRQLAKEVFKCYQMESSGKFYNLYSYLNPGESWLGAGIDGKANVQTVNAFTRNGILCTNAANEISILKNRHEQNSYTPLTFENYENVKFVTYRIMFWQEDDADTNKVYTPLYAFPVNEKGTQWELAFSADGAGSIYDLALFPESLNFDRDKVIQVSMETTNDDMPEALNSTVAEFNQQFTKETMIDWFDWVRFAIGVFSLWLFFMIWFAYFILKRGLGYTFFEALAKPGREGDGFDLIKMATIGLFNIDSEPDLPRVTLITGILILIDVLLIYVL